MRHTNFMGAVLDEQSHYVMWSEKITNPGDFLWSANTREEMAHNYFARPAEEQPDSVMMVGSSFGYVLD